MTNPPAYCEYFYASRRLDYITVLNFNLEEAIAKAEINVRKVNCELTMHRSTCLSCFVSCA